MSDYRENYDYDLFEAVSRFETKSTPCIRDTATETDKDADAPRTRAQSSPYRSSLRSPRDTGDRTPQNAADAATDRTAARRRVYAKKMRVYHRGKLAITCAVIGVLTLLAFALPLRPKVSATEKRELAKFPALSFSSLFDGSFFAGISTWFSDTVPFRDSLTGMNAKVQHLLGTGGAQAGFNEGVQGDEIPDVPNAPPAQNTAADTETSEPESVSDDLTSQSAQSTQAPSTEAPVTSAPPSTPEPAFEALGSILVSGNAGYEYYNFVQATADRYTDTINRAADVLAGKAQVYAMVIPTSTGITLDPRVQKRISSSDQKKATAYLESRFSQKVKTVPLYDALLQHKDEYVYFRTDHHWTGLGAYYAYVEFCGKKGVRPVARENCVRRSFDGFLGSFYADSGRDPALGNKPDTVDTYMPPVDASITITDKQGATFSGDVIYNAENSIAAYKYSAFIWGDNPFSVIENHSRTEGESCLLVKESFGNALAPLLIGNYKTVYVMDYRYCQKTVSQLVAEYGIKDVIFANNISMTRASSLVEQLAAKIG